MGERVSAVSTKQTQQQDDDDIVRALFVDLISFVALAKASHKEKDVALDAIQKLQARLLP